MKKDFDYSLFGDNKRYVKERANAVIVAASYPDKYMFSIFNKDDWMMLVKKIKSLSYQCDGLGIIEEARCFIESCRVVSSPKRMLGVSNEEDANKVMAIIDFFVIMIKAEFISAPHGAFKYYAPSKELKAIMKSFFIRKFEWTKEESELIINSLSTGYEKRAIGN